MPQSTVGVTPATVPRTAAEETALRALYQHVGTRTRPNCGPCVATVDGCPEGRTLRRAVSSATSRRAQPGVRG
ncbi:hypothetical protein [Streptomyces sp. NPDC005012]|uniref:hypothetical protein n=1 Tax=Streptomyces sp. NPDC005012 TaxID=3154558 RepID=UPI0033BA37F5